MLGEEVVGFRHKSCDSLQDTAMNFIVNKLNSNPKIEHFPQSRILPATLWRPLWQKYWSSLAEDDKGNINVKRVFRLFSGSSIKHLDLRRFFDISLDVDFSYRNILTLNLCDTDFQPSELVRIIQKLLNVRDLNFTNCENFDLKCLAAVAGHCRDLEHLNITDTNISYLDIVRAVYGSAFTFPFSKLISFNVGEGSIDAKGHGGFTTRVLLKNCPNLRRLDLGNLMLGLFEIWMELKEAQDQHRPFAFEPLKLTYIRHTELNGDISLDFFNDLHWLCPNLEALQVDIHPVLRNGKHLTTATRLPHLRRLRFYDGIGLSSHTPLAMEFIHCYSDNLTELKFYHVSDLRLPAILDLCPNLKKLCVTSENSDCFQLSSKQDPSTVYPGLVHFCHRVVCDNLVFYEDFGLNPFKMMPNLSELKLINRRFVNADEYLRRILVEEETLRSLEYLCLNGSNAELYPTDQFVYFLVQNLDKLPRLKTIRHLCCGWGEYPIRKQIKHFLRVNNIDFCYIDDNIV